MLHCTQCLTGKSRQFLTLALSPQISQCHV